jgi:hypothetical protein
VISIPAIAEADDPLGREPGELLWDEPEGYNYAAFLKARQRETSPMMWAALYQQRPARSRPAAEDPKGQRGISNPMTFPAQQRSLSEPVGRSNCLQVSFLRTARGINS